MLTIKELKNPEALAHIQFSETKQEIARKWDEKRRFNEVGNIHLEDNERIYLFFNEIKSLLFDGFREDFPEESMTPRMMKIWLGQNVIAYGNMKDIKSRNIWIDLYECFMLLRQTDRLETDENGILI
jgi:hypothetical protein